MIYMSEQKTGVILILVSLLILTVTCVAVPDAEKNTYTFDAGEEFVLKEDVDNTIVINNTVIENVESVKQTDEEIVVKTENVPWQWGLAIFAIVIAIILLFVGCLFVIFGD